MALLMVMDMVDGPVMVADIMEVLMDITVVPMGDMVMEIMEITTAASHIILIVTFTDMADMIWEGSLGIIEDTITIIEIMHKPKMRMKLILLMWPQSQNKNHYLQKNTRDIKQHLTKCKTMKQKLKSLLKMVMEETKKNILLNELIQDMMRFKEEELMMHT